MWCPYIVTDQCVIILNTNGDGDCDGDSVGDGDDVGLFVDAVIVVSFITFITFITNSRFSHLRASSPCTCPHTERRWWDVCRCSHRSALFTRSPQSSNPPQTLQFRCLYTNKICSFLLLLTRQARRPSYLKERTFFYWMIAAGSLCSYHFAQIIQIWWNLGQVCNCKCSLNYK